MTAASPVGAETPFAMRAMIAGRHPPQTVPAPHLRATSAKLHAPSLIAEATVRAVIARHRQTYNSATRRQTHGGIGGSLVRDAACSRERAGRPRHLEPDRGAHLQLWVRTHDAHVQIHAIL